MVDPTLPNPGAGGILGAYTYFGTGTGRNGRKRPQDVYGKAIGPRLGFAYSVNSKTVLRGGYGIFYEPLKEGSFADQDGLGFFNRQTVNVTNGGPTQIDNGVTRIFPDSGQLDRKSTRLNSSHANISYAVFCLKKKRYSYYARSIRRRRLYLQYYA